MAREIPDKAALLVEKGVLKDGDPAYLIHNLPYYVRKDPQKDEFRGTIRVIDGKPRVQWAKDGEIYSLSAVALQVINEHRDGPARPSAAGGEHWGTLEACFARIAEAHEAPSSHEARFRWMREELILALDLYFQLGRKYIDARNPRVIELSEELRRLGIHPPPWPENFRNPNSVALRLSNFLAIDPEHEGQGMDSGGNHVQEIWNEFHNDRDALLTAVRTIRVGARVPDPGDSDEEATEGRARARLHISRERNPALARKAKHAFRKKHGRLYCEVCGFDFAQAYGERGEDYIEAHHKVPLSDLDGESMTRASDLAMLCANCHRMIHAKRPWITIEELREILHQSA